MEGLLCRWVLSMQEYTMQYHSGSENTNADALSWCDSDVPSHTVHSALTQVSNSEAKQTLLNVQRHDPVVKKISQELLQSTKPPTSRKWKRPPLARYQKLWSQLSFKDGIVCRSYTLDPAIGTVTVPILPKALHQQYLQSNHNIPSADHQGIEKTLHQLWHEAYWVNMAGDVYNYCCKCSPCQQSKQLAPVRASLTSVPIGNPWQMIAVDILEVPLSVNNNRYLLVVQDYFTKWAKAIPIHNQNSNCHHNWGY